MTNLGPLCDADVSGPSKTLSGREGLARLGGWLSLRIEGSMLDLTVSHEECHLA